MAQSLSYAQRAAPGCGWGQSPRPWGRSGAVRPQARAGDHFIFVATIVAVFLIATDIQAEAIDDAVAICADYGNNPEKRTEEFRKVGWSTTGQDDSSLSALTDAILRDNTPDSGSPEVWSTQRARAEARAKEFSVEYQLSRDDACVWIGWRPNTGHAGCFVAAQASQASFDLFRVPEALGTISVNEATLGDHQNIPFFIRKLAAEAAVTFITGPLR